MRGSRVVCVPAVLAVLVLGLAGCGGDGDEPGASGPVTATVTATATETTTVTASPVPAGDDEPAAAGAPTSYDEAVARVETGTDVGSLEAFTTPDGAVWCSLLLEGLPAACELSEGVPDEQVCADAPSSDVGRVELVGGVPQAVCNTDTIRTAEATVLEPGSSATTRDTACLSEAIGVTCVARNGSGGFFVGPGRYALLLP